MAKANMNKPFQFATKNINTFSSKEVSNMEVCIVVTYNLLPLMTLFWLFQLNVESPHSYSQ